jgi:predicted small secreted protein
MTTHIKRIVALLFVSAVLTLVTTGCNTTKGFGEDVERAGEKIQGD